MAKTSLNKDKKEAREFQTPTSGIFFKVGKILYSRRSAFQKIEIIRNREFGRVLFLDGLVQTTEKDEFFYHEMLVHPAMACHRFHQFLISAYIFQAEHRGIHLR